MCHLTHCHISLAKPLWLKTQNVLLSQSQVSEVWKLYIITLNQASIYMITSRNPNRDPAVLLFYSAGIGSISGMKKVVGKDPKMIYVSDIFNGRSTMYFIAQSQNLATLWWLLKKCIPWSMSDKEGLALEELAKMCKTDKLYNVLREWKSVRLFLLTIVPQDQLRL